MIIARGLLVLVLFCRMRPWFYGLLHEMRDNISRYMVAQGSGFDSRIRAGYSARYSGRICRSLVRADVVVVARNGKPVPRITLQQYF